MLHLKENIFRFTVLIGLIFLAACSAERKNVISKTYHNTTARYNAYFYAKQRINEVKDIVDQNYDNDYNNILEIYPKVDSTLATSYETQIEDAIQKASIAIQRHQNSKWVDDSYILIGQARFYSLDFVNAIKTYKFVNTKSEDPDARHEALVRLHRTFTDAQELDNAVAVSDYLKKEKLNKDNYKLLYLNRAHYYQLTGDLDNMVQNLVKAAPLLKKKDGKGRLYFIIGQVYQKLGFDAEAFNYYKKCIASNPVYELDFYARLYMAQVTELNSSSDVRASRKLFKKLLVDKKNKEFKDKIYYEMAEFELKRSNLDQAIEYYKESVKSSISNNRQKGQSYLKLGIIYYDSLRQYELAEAYYDSTVTTLPSDFENYDKIKERQEVLSDFVDQIKTIQLQDSLLILASLDTSALRLKIEGIVTAEEEKKKEEEEKAKKRARQNNFNTSLQENTGIGSTGWYFGNPSAVALGQNDFKRIWGDRPLEDNWRRSNKENFQTFEEKDQNLEAAAENGGETTLANDESNINSRVDRLMSQVPHTDDAKKASLDKIEIALYKLGNIYNFNLEEEKNAASTFDQLLDRFPNTVYEPEVLYQLYLIYKNIEDLKYEKYKQKLIDKYPNTTYAKLLSNPNYTEESTEANEQQKRVYKIAYAEYERKEYRKALNTIDEALNTYQETIFTPRLILLKILIIGRTEDINLYQFELSKFVDTHPDSDVTPYAQELLTASRNFQDRQRRLLGTEYARYYGQEHYFVLIYESKSKLADKLSGMIESHNEVNYEDLSTSNLILNNDLAMIMVTGFGSRGEGLKYYLDFVKNDIIQQNTLNSKFHKFVITKDNFNIFYQSKDWEAYLRFFDKYYLNEL